MQSKIGKRWLATAGALALLPVAAVQNTALAADTLPGVQAGAVQYLSDVELDSVSTGYGEWQRDFRNLGNADKNKYLMQVAGQTFYKGIGLHVPAELNVSTNGDCSQMLAYVGVDDSGTATNGSFYANWVFEGTMANGETRQLAQVETRKGEVAPLVDVDLSGVETLTIYAKQLVGGNNGGSFADLGEAQLNCADSPIAYDPRVFVGETDLDRLTPGGEVEFLVWDAQPNSDITVDLNDERIASVKAFDSGATPVKFTIPADMGTATADFKITTVDMLGSPVVTDMTGAVTIPNQGQFYIDCASPENGDGTQNNPFNSVDPLNEMEEFGAGTQILFKKGTSCTGRLELRGDGTAEARNIISSYGDGEERPILDADGEVNVIELIDTSYWTIEGLHLKNPATLTETPTERQGIMIRSLSTAPKASIVINDNLISDVAGWPNKTGNNPRYRNSGAIVIMADHELSGPEPGLTDGVTLTNNEITDVGGGGIKLQGDGQNNSDKSKFHKNVHIANNNIHQVGGDAIVVHASDSALVEYNRGVDLGQGAYPFQAGNFAGIWGMTSKELLFRYNVVGNSTDTSYDSTAWDCDWGMTGASCIFEYNYSYNNAGGAFLDCISGCGNVSTNTRSVMRYNVMQDDCRLAGASGGPAHTWIYNNTFYCPTKTLVDDMSGPRTVYNNIFVAKDGSWDGKTNSYNERVYRNNAYFGGIQPPAAEQDSIVDADPMLLAPGSSKDVFDVSGYALKADSPLIGVGIDLEQFDDAAGVDIFDNDVTMGTNIGAYGGDGVAARPLTWEEALNTTSIAHDGNLRTGGVEFTTQFSKSLGRGRDAFLASALSVNSGEEITTDGFTFVWDPVVVGTPDSVKAAGQEIAVGKGGEKLHFVGFSTGSSRGGQVTIKYADGTVQEANMELPNWHETTGEAESVVEAMQYNNHSGSYLAKIATKTGPARVYASSIDLVNTASEVTSVTLPDGLPVIGDGLTLFALGITGEMGEPVSSVEVETSVTSRCVAGKVTQVISARNIGENPVDISITSPHGTKNFKDISPDRSSSVALSTRAKEIDAGTVSFTATDTEGNTANTQVDYPSTSCK